MKDGEIDLNARLETLTNELNTKWSERLRWRNISVNKNRENKGVFMLSVKAVFNLLATKSVKALCPRGAFWHFTGFKREKYSISSPFPPIYVVLLFELPIENNKHPNFEWRGGGVWILFFFLSAVSQQFCHQLFELQNWPFILKKTNSTHFLPLGCKTLGSFLFVMINIITPSLEK